MSRNDAHTTLNPGSGGDNMNESSSTQDDGTIVKTPRVVPALDTGKLVGKEDGTYAPMPVASASIEKLLTIQNDWLAKIYNVLLGSRHR